MAQPWEQRAKDKREAILAAIPQEWRMQNPPNSEQVDVTGSFIQQFLSEKEVEITETTADEIVKYTVSGRWSAEEVTRAFCHRAALAHQLVLSPPAYRRRRADRRTRQTVCTRSSSMPPSRTPKQQTPISRNTRSPSAPCTASPLA